MYKFYFCRIKLLNILFRFFIGRIKEGNNHKRKAKQIRRCTLINLDQVKTHILLAASP